MPLRLVLGPAGARKVGELLDAHSAASRAGRTAWFVVPSAADVEPFQRELAGVAAPPGQPNREPSPFGQVMTGAGLERRLLARLGHGQRMLSPDHRRAVALAAIRGTRLEALGPAARSGWLAGELIGLSEELATSGDLGGRAEEGLLAWGARTSDGRGGELAGLLREDARLLDRLAHAPGVRQVDRAAAAAIVAAAVSAKPADVADLHLALSGFDDLDPVQRALVIALGRSDAQVVVSLPYEEGREALSAATGLVATLATVAEPLQPVAAEGAAGAVAPALAAVEQRLYEQVVFQAPEAVDDPLEAFASGPPSSLGPLVPEYLDDPGVGAPGPPQEPSGGATAAPLEPDVRAALGAAVLELRGGGPDEEAALIAEHLAAHVAAGTAPDRIAVAVGQPAVEGPRLQAALARAGLGAHLAAARPSRIWPSIAALVALLQAAGVGGEARHLVDWVAGPGGPGGADAFDAAVRRRGAHTVRDGLRVWRSLGNPDLGELDGLWAAVRNTAAPGALEMATAAALRGRLGQALDRAEPLSPAEERDLRAAGQVLGVLDGLATLAGQVPELGLGLDELRELIAELKSPREQEPAGSIAIVGPLDVRTRYLEVVVVARAQRGSYPASEPMRRVLTRGDRAALHEHHGWPRPAVADHAARERYLAYEVVARATRQLVVSWHDGNGDGKPCEPSPLLAEVRRAAGGAVPSRSLPSGSAARHALGAERLANIEGARNGPRHREPSPVHAPLLAAQPREHYAVGALQTAARCPAQWFVDHHLRPRPLSPDAAPLTAGRMRHDVLRQVVSAVVTDGAPLGPAALEPMRAVLADAAARLAVQGEEHRETLAERLMRERVIAEIEATLPALCGEAPLAHQPTEFELAFGTSGRAAAEDHEDDGDEDADGAGDARPPVTVERGGERLVLAGRIDRLDASPSGELVVVDYKGANVDQYKGSGWIDARELQAGLYALVAEQLVGEGARAVASMYQPVPGPLGQAARGATAAELAGRGKLTRGDRLEPEEWDELLDALARLAGEARRLIDDGIVTPDPGRCSAGGCRYPWLCREVQA